MKIRIPTLITLPSIALLAACAGDLGGHDVPDGTDRHSAAFPGAGALQGTAGDMRFPDQGPTRLGSASHVGTVALLADAAAGQAPDRQIRIDTAGVLDPAQAELLGRAVLTAHFDGQGSLSGTFDQLTDRDGRPASGEILFSSSDQIAGIGGTGFDGVLSGSVDIGGESLDLSRISGALIPAGH